MLHGENNESPFCVFGIKKHAGQLEITPIKLAKVAHIREADSLG